MYVSLCIRVDKGKVLVPWTIVNIDQDCTFEELFGKVKVGPESDSISSMYTYSLA